MTAPVPVLLALAVVVALVTGAAVVVELRRLGDLLEAVNHAIERVAVTLRQRK